VQATRGVEDHDVVAEALRVLDPALADLGRAALRPLGVHGEIELLAERLELIDRGRALEVGRDEQRVLLLLAPQYSASLAQVVVLPVPCRPAIITIERAGVGDRHRHRLSSPRAAPSVRRGRP
jgi:hypothetical protein